MSATTEATYICAGIGCVKHHGTSTSTTKAPTTTVGTQPQPAAPGVLPATGVAVGAVLVVAALLIAAGVLIGKVLAWVESRV